MTDRTPDVPLRMAFTVEVPGTPEQVWDAIATAKGNTAWFLPTEIDEREGGALCFHMPPDGDSRGTVTGWDPPRRVAYEEPDWAAHQPTPVTPLATEMLVEAKSGGTCVVRVVSSAFGTGAEWEREFFQQMEDGWLPFFEQLRLYLVRFAGQTANTFNSYLEVPGTHADATAAIASAAGEMSDVAVQWPSKEHAIVTFADGYVGMSIFPEDDGVAIRLLGYVFGRDASEDAARWDAWLQSLAIAST